MHNFIFVNRLQDIRTLKNRTNFKLVSRAQKLHSLELKTVCLISFYHSIDSIIIFYLTNNALRMFLN